MIRLCSSCFFVFAVAALVAAPDPDLFDGRVREASTPSAERAESAGGSSGQEAESADAGGSGSPATEAGESPSERDYESIAKIGGAPVASSGSKAGAAELPAGSESESTTGVAGLPSSGGGSTAAGDSSAAGASSAGERAEGAGTVSGESGGEERSFDDFGIGASGADATVEVNRSKVSLPPGPVIGSGTQSSGPPVGGEAQQGASGGTVSGSSQTDRGTDVPSGL